MVDKSEGGGGGGPPGQFDQQEPLPGHQLGRRVAVVRVLDQQGDSYVVQAVELGAEEKAGRGRQLQLGFADRTAA